jgi:hypothetical protein
MSNQNFCTVQEFAEFANTTPPTIDNLAKWLKEKTANKYTIVEISLLKNIYDKIDDNLKHLIKFNLDAMNALELLGTTNLGLLGITNSELFKITNFKQYNKLDKIIDDNKCLLERLEIAIGDE